jgi:hypothetical protein
MHMSKEMTLESAMACNHCTKKLFELQFWVLQFIFVVYFYNLILDESKWWSQAM